MSHPRPMWLDEWGGPRWRYGLTYRPVAFSAVPQDFLNGSHESHPKFRFGTIIYRRRLSEAEVSGYELTPVCASCPSPKGDQDDPLSPYCRACDPDGALFFDVIRAGQS